VYFCLSSATAYKMHSYFAYPHTLLKVMPRVNSACGGGTLCMSRVMRTPLDQSNPINLAKLTSFLKCQVTDCVCLLKFGIEKTGYRLSLFSH
jgi:hypothetical protein